MTINKIKKGINLIKKGGIQEFIRALYFRGNISDRVFGWLFILYSKMSEEEKEKAKDFTAKKVEKKTVLVIEACDHHGECIPAYVNYFLKLGYKVDVIMTNQEEKEKPLNSDLLKVVDCYGMERRTMREVLKGKNIQKYEYIFFNSMRVYLPKYSVIVTVQELFREIKKYNKKMLFVDHAPEFLNDTDIENNKLIMLADMKLQTKKKPAIVIPSYFTEFSGKIKNETVTFVIVGALNAKTRNVNLVEHAIDYLKINNYENFQIVVIGRSGNVKLLEEKYGKMICFRGRLNYPDMYEELKKADFFLPLLDPDNEDHLLYNTVRSSGSFQLIYGFRIPCIIEKTFAESHGYNKENSVIYEGNSDMGRAMEKAIKMSGEEYGRLVTSLDELTAKIELDSMNNLKGLLDG